MNYLFKQQMLDITADTIENTDEFKFITSKIKTRAELGYNFVEIDGDDELLRCLNSFSIKDYLDYLGFFTGDTIIKWRW